MILHQKNILEGTFPLEKDIVPEIEEFCSILKKYNVQVFRPKEKKGLNQIFARDIAFVIDDNIIRINRNEMYEMCANVFSISNNVIVSQKKYFRLNNVLREKGFIVEELKYSEISKMGGLLRCSTMPLRRKK